MPTGWYVAPGILVLGLVPLCFTAENPKEDRAKTLTKLFDAMDTPNVKAHAKARDALYLALVKGGRGDLDVVAKAAKDKRTLVRVAGMGLLARFKGHPQTEPPDIPGMLIDGLSDKEPQVRVMAAVVACAFAADSPALVKALVKALDDPDPDPTSLVSGAAAMALREIGKKARPAYADLIRTAGNHKLEFTRKFAYYCHWETRSRGQGRATSSNKVSHPASR